MIRNLKPLFLALALAALTIMVVLFPIGEWLTVGAAWIEAHPQISWLAFIAAYLVAAVLLIPGSLLTLAAGFLFGLPVGIALVSVGSLLGASAAFLIGRFFARGWIEHRVASMPRFKALDSATRREGFLIVLLARLSLLFPFNLLNYGLALTGVRFRDFAIASWAGMLPAIVLYVYVGTLANDLTQLGRDAIEGSLAGRVLLVVGFAATLALSVLITRKATRVLRAHLRGTEEMPDA